MSGNKTPVEAMLRIDTSAPVVTVIEQFGTASAEPSAGDHDMSTVLHGPAIDDTANKGDPQVAAAISYLRQQLSRSDNFVSGLLLSGQRGELALYSQWLTPSGGAPVNVPDAWSLAPAIPDLHRVDAHTFTVDFTAPGSFTEVLQSRTPRAHFGVFTVNPDKQERLLELARRHAPGSIGTPGLAAINFHRSVDGHRVVNLGLWNGFSEFSNLLTRPGFATEAEYWLDVAGFRPHFFDIAELVTR